MKRHVHPIANGSAGDATVASTVAAQLDTVRPVRPEVVVRLRRELAAGHYAPPVEQVADRLVRPILSRQPRITRWR